MASNYYCEVLVNSCYFLSPKRKELFYAEIKVSAFVNFKVDCLKKIMMMMKKLAV